MSFVIAASDNGQGLFAFAKESREQLVEEATVGITTIKLVVERTVGTFGSVSLRWDIDPASMCTSRTSVSQCPRKLRESDLQPGQATSGVIHFGEGQKSHAIEIRLKSENHPEDDESFKVNLKLTTTSSKAAAEVAAGGKTAAVTLAYNDDGRGVLLVDAKSRFLVGNEGETLKVLVVRSVASFGQITATWSITNDASGKLAEKDFTKTTGVLVFKEGQRQIVVPATLKDDAAPETATNFTFALSKVTGGASLQSTQSFAVLKLRGSDDPHGVISVAPASNVVFRTKPFENSRDIKLQLKRDRGTEGNIRVTFKVHHKSQIAAVTARNVKVLEKLNAQLQAVVIKDSVSSFKHLLALPDELFLAKGDVIRVDLAAVKLVQDNGQLIESTSPRLDFSKAEAVTTVGATTADNILGFDLSEQDTLVLSEGKPSTVTVMRYSTFGSLACDIIAEDANGQKVADVTTTVCLKGKPCTTGTSSVTVPAGMSEFTVTVLAIKDKKPELQSELTLRIANVQVRHLSTPRFAPLTHISCYH